MHQAVTHVYSFEWVFHAFIVSHPWADKRDPIIQAL